MSWLETKRTIGGVNREKIFFLVSAALCAGLLSISMVPSAPLQPIPQEVFARNDKHKKPGADTLYKPEEVGLKDLLTIDRNPFFPYRVDNITLTDPGKTPAKSPSLNPKTDVKTDVTIPSNPRHQEQIPSKTNTPRQTYTIPFTFKGVMKKEDHLFVILESTVTNKVYELTEGETKEGVRVESINKNEVTLKGEDGILVIRKDDVAEKYRW